MLKKKETTGTREGGREVIEGGSYGCQNHGLEKMGRMGREGGRKGRREGVEATHESPLSLL